MIHHRRMVRNKINFWLEVISDILAFTFDAVLILWDNFFCFTWTSFIVFAYCCFASLNNIFWTKRNYGYLTKTNPASWNRTSRLASVVVGFCAMEIYQSQVSRHSYKYILCLIFFLSRYLTSFSIITGKSRGVHEK